MSPNNTSLYPGKPVTLTVMYDDQPSRCLELEGPIKRSLELLHNGFEHEWLRDAKMLVLAQ